MAGIIRRALPKREYDFTNSAVGSSPSFVVAQRLDISGYIDCVMEVRFHADTIPSGSNSIRVDLYGDGYCDEDSSLTFITAAPFFTGASISGNQLPFLFTGGGKVLGQYAAVVVSATLGVAVTTKATISVDLILRSPDDT
jgi:hypothetical protein